MILKKQTATTVCFLLVGTRFVFYCFFIKNSLDKKCIFCKIDILFSIDKKGKDMI